MDLAANSTPARPSHTRGRLGAFVCLLLVTAALGGSLLVATGPGSATPGNAPVTDSPATPGAHPSPTPHHPASAPLGPGTDPSDVPPGPPWVAGGGDVNATWNASTYDACAGKGFVWGGICNVIEDTKRTIIGGALDVTGALVDTTLALLLRRPAPRSGGEITILRPPTNQPMAGAFSGWQSVGLPLGFLLWVIGAGVALASRFRPDASFATTGFRIEENLARNLLLVLGSWWLGAFVLHLANAVIRVAAPTASELGPGVKTSLGSVLAAGFLVWVFYVAAAFVAGILLAATVLAYFLSITFMVFLPVFSALLLFKTDGVLGTLGWFGQKGWDIFIRAAIFPLPAALVLGAGIYVAGGTIPVVEQAIATGGFTDIAGMLSYAIVMFVVLVTALLASLWMIMGARGAGTAAGVIAGLGGAALYNRAKGKVGAVKEGASTPSIGSSPDGATTSATRGWSPGSPGPGHQWGGALGSGGPTDAAGVLGAGSSATRAGGLARMEVPTGGRPTSSAATSDAPTRGSISAGGGAGIGPAVNVGSGDHSEPIVVTGKRDLPAGQKYQMGFLSEGEFQPTESRGQSREFVVRHHDRFADIFDSEGDHSGIYLRGEIDDRLYDASAVGGEDWGLSLQEEAAMSREAVYDAREAGGGPQ